MTAFRDNFANEPNFAQHVGVAEDLLDRIERIPSLLAETEAMTQEALDLSREWATSWADAWAQLQEARALAVKHGRDVSAYDAARAAAGDLYLDIDGGKAERIHKDSKFAWKNASTRPARDAVAALRAAMPEVVVTQQAPVDIKLRSHSVWILEILGGVAAIGVMLYVLYRLFR